MSQISSELKNEIQTSPSGLFVHLPCELCGQSDFMTLMESKIPKTMDSKDLQKLYRAASDQELLDPLVQCRHCELVQVRPILNPEFILAGYEEEPGDDFVTQNPFRIRTFDAALARLEKILGWKSRSDLKVLDIGCAGGAFPKAALDRGYQAHGLEPNRYMSDFARKQYGLKVETGTDIENAFSGEKFDVITLWDVIEHLVHPGDSLKTIRKRLKPNGNLVLNFPDLDTWPVKIMRRKWPFYLSVHLYYFTPKTLTKLLQREGFEVISVRPHYQTLELGYVIQRAIKILPFLKVFSIFSKGFIGRLPFTYYLGQTQIVAKPV